MAEVLDSESSLARLRSYLKEDIVLSSALAERDLGLRYFFLKVDIVTFIEILRKQDVELDAEYRLYQHQA